MEMTMKNARDSRIGMSLKSQRFEEEMRLFLQKRLRILTSTVSILLVFLSVIFILSLAGEPARNLWQAILHFCTHFPNSVLFFLAGSSTILAVSLWRKRAATATLNIIDALFLQTLMGPCLYLYARLHFFEFSGFAVVVPFLMLFILARAVLIPSTAWRTILLSLPAPIGVILIQLQAGASFSHPGQPYEPMHFSDSLMQNQILLLGSIAVAAIASKVNLGLRRQNFNARNIGQYKIEKLLGEGGMGEVYLATHSLLKRPTAVKFLRPEIAGVHALTRFEHEVRHTSRLSHPNTITIYDYGHTAEGIFYYVMELLKGANLYQIVTNTGPMPAARVIHILASACGALSEAHLKGIIHRDIKPQNIMLCDKGGEQDIVKILDFGLVKDIHDPSTDMDEPGSISGTPETMSPEAQTDEFIGPASDIYSLCAVGCFLLTGKPIFDANTVSEFLEAHLESAPIPPSNRRPGIPDDLENILLQGLEKTPSRRPENVKALQDSLTSCRDYGQWDSKDADNWWTEHGESLVHHRSPKGETLTQLIQNGTDVTLTIQNLKES
jgi:serine/threonine-protein kinase